MANFFAKYLVFLTLLLTSVLAATSPMPVANTTTIAKNSTSIITATSTATAIITDETGTEGRPAEKTSSPDDQEGAAAGVSVRDPGFILLSAGFAMMTFGMAALV